MEKKSIIKSKTIWFNTLSLTLVIVNELSGKVIPTDIAAAIVCVGNILLRTITNNGVTVKN